MVTMCGWLSAATAVKLWQALSPPCRHGSVRLKCQALCLTWRFHDSRHGEVGSAPADIFDMELQEAPGHPVLNDLAFPRSQWIARGTVAVSLRAGIQRGWRNEHVFSHSLSDVD
jgi:hypothetical protein